MKNSPLADKHHALNAKMADFGGWLMPIEYPGAGVLQNTQQYANELEFSMYLTSAKSA
jgi:glycine cleavage system aminomethyltransferase T